MRRIRLLAFAAVLIPILGAGCAAGPPPSGAVTPTVSTAIVTTTTTLSKAQLALQDMTLREKAAQALLIALPGTTFTDDVSALLEDGPPGGLLLLGSNVESAAQVRGLTTALQEAAAATGSPVGLLVAVDQEGGTVQRIKDEAPLVPTARSLGTGSTPADAAALANTTAVALLNMGVNTNLAPVADVVSDESSFLYARTYGSDASQVSSFVSAVVEGYEDYGLICVVKHFPGHGSAPGDSHKEAVVSTADKATFESVHLPPFRAAIAAGVDGVMMSHIVAPTYDPDNPASASVALVDLLRSQLGFDGLIVTDDLRMVAASGDSSVQGEGEAQAAVAALVAGCDLLILTQSATSKIVIDSLVAAVETGALSQARLDEAVRRVLDLKFRHGIVTGGR